VIVRYAGAQGATGGTANTTSAPGYTVHTFTGPGVFTTNAALYSVN
jgi:tripartite-type tricarboxylate transporter receptor subunit TctC